MSVDENAEKKVPQVTVLCVDDEKNILNSMKRLLRKQPCKLLTAESGADALELMKSNKVHLIISDMRMPNMTGAELLEQVAENSPDTYRILLTGFADMESTVAAVNKGKIHRYMQKPWDNDELIAAIEEGIEAVSLKAENKRLQQRVAEQNKQLKQSNLALEDKVLLRTKQIRAAMHRIENNNNATQRMLFNFIAINPKLDAGFAKNTGQLAGRIAEHLKLEKQQISDITLAGYLCEIGMLGLDPTLAELPFYKLNYDQQKLFFSQIQMAQSILSPAQHMHAITEIIMHQYEHANGSGYPNKLTEVQIPMGAKILAVARDYWRYATGKLSDETMDVEHIRVEMNKNRGTKYAGNVLDVLMNNPELTANTDLEKGYSPDQLKPGMILKNNLHTENHMLILPEGHIFSEASIEKLKAFEKNKQQSLSVVVVKKAKATEKPVSTKEE
ncbi:response regulator [Alteromonadaceae bacterium M269]|nr:response regulator [Alteromonadaceae bacterium M269]